MAAKCLLHLVVKQLNNSTDRTVNRWTCQISCLVLCSIPNIYLSLFQWSEDLWPPSSLPKAKRLSNICHTLHLLLSLVVLIVTLVKVSPVNTDPPFRIVLMCSCKCYKNQRGHICWSPSSCKILSCYFACSILWPVLQLWTSKFNFAIYIWKTHGVWAIAWEGFILHE